MDGDPKKGGKKLTEKNVPYGRLINWGNDIRLDAGLTFAPTPPIYETKRLSVELAVNMAPSCARTFHGRPINRKDGVEWKSGTSKVSASMDIREFGNVCGYWVQQKCANCGRNHWTD